MMRTLLLTAGRGTYALSLARRFHSEGYRVLVSDAWPHTLCRYSSAVSRYFRVPSPARETSAWLDSIWEIAERQSVDLIIPIYEEVFYLAQAKAARKDGPPLFAPSFETLISLHDKWLFIEKARELGLPVPQTTRIASRDELVRVFAQREPSRTVYKPVYSRFAAQTVVRPQGIEVLDGIEPTATRPWIAQEYLPGRPFATFSIAHQGRIAAHAT
jgi:predicted ATP-grasp superfamily ATP-dependent carboligase